MANFDQLNRQTWMANNYGNSHHPTSGDNSRMGMGASEYLAYLNNQTFKANNGAYPDRPYTSYGTCSKGK